MLPRGILLHLEIVFFAALYANGQNPFFVCDDDTAAAAVSIVPIVGNEIVISCNNLSVVDYIVDRISRTTLRRRPFHVQMNASSDLNTLTLSRLVDNLDLSRNDLIDVDLERFGNLKILNLTSNRIRSLGDIKLAPNVTLTSLNVSRNRLLTFEHVRVPPCERLYLRANYIFDLKANVTLPATLLELDLTRNEIENLTSVRFASRNLTILNLSVNLISAVSKSTFADLPNLERLLLQCNKLLDIEVGTFSGNGELLELNLRDNNLSVLRTGVFDDLSRLRILDISKNDFLQLSSDVAQNLNNIVDFSLSENAKLCAATATRCHHELDVLLTLGGQLKTLNLARLGLRQFPVVLTTAVRHLNLSANKLNAVQLGDLENFPFLETLMLTDNQIQTIEDNIFVRTEFLRTLWLDDNELRRVPSPLPPSLTSLQLSRNRITRIDGSDLCSPNLLVLKLDSNLIQSVESGSFVCLTSLQTLDISANPVLRLDTDAFDGPISLRTFYATDLRYVQTNATNLRYFPMSEMPSLRSLNLSRSPELVRSFLNDAPLLATVKQIEVIDLSYAKLDHVPRTIQPFLPRVKLLRLVGNPLNCSADLPRDWSSAATYSFDSCADDETSSTGTLTLRITSKPIETAGNGVKIEGPCWVDEDVDAAAAAQIRIKGDEFWKKVEADKCATDRSGGLSTIRDNAMPPPPPTAVLISATSYESGNLSIASLTLETYHKANNNPLLGTSRRSLASSTLLPSTNVSQRRLYAGTSFESLIRVFPTVTQQSSHSVVDYYDASRATSTTQFSTVIRDVSTSSNDGGISPTSPFSAVVAAATVVIATESNIVHAKNNSRSSKIPRPPNKGHYESLVWNQTDDAFFDWFPAAAAPPPAAAQNNDNNSDAEDGVEHSPADPDNLMISYTHPGVIIFSAVTCFLTAVFAAIFVPSCLRKYKWRQHRYKISEFDNEYQRSMEISSISAFVDSEIPLDP